MYKLYSLQTCLFFWNFHTFWGRLSLLFNECGFSVRLKRPEHEVSVYLYQVAILHMSGPILLLPPQYAIVVCNGNFYFFYAKECTRNKSYYIRQSARWTTWRREQTGTHHKWHINIAISIAKFTYVHGGRKTIFTTTTITTVLIGFPGFHAGG